MIKINLNIPKKCSLFIILYLSVSLDIYSQTNVTKFEYIDGSANSYIIDKNKIEYIPIKPEESSTGTYDGGEPALKNISEADYDTIQAMIEELATDTSQHITDRIKTSGLIRIYKNDDVYAYIISPNSRLLVTFESKLKQLIE